MEFKASNSSFCGKSLLSLFGFGLLHFYKQRTQYKNCICIQLKLKDISEVYIFVLQGILASGVCFTLFAWCVRLKGPLFVSAFNPLMLVLVAFAGAFLLNEYITIGR